MKQILLSIALIFFSLSTPATADQARFDQAINAWLELDNETAYPLLSELAHEGYEPAMLFLGSLSLQRSSLSILGLRTIPREFIKGLSFTAGESWLTQVEDDQAVAWAIQGHTHHPRENITWSVDITESEQYMEAAFTLAQRGEFVLASQKFHSGVSSWQPTQDEIRDFIAQDYPDYVKLYQWFVGVHLFENGNERDGLIQALETNLNRGALNALYFHQRFFPNIVDQWPQRTRDFAQMSNLGYYHFDPSLTVNPKNIPDFERALVADSIAEPLVNYCSKTCPDEINSCTGMLFTAMGGYSGMVMNHAPLQSVIPDERYFASAQFENSLRTRGQYYDYLIENIELGSCTAALATELGGEE